MDSLYRRETRRPQLLQQEGGGYAAAGSSAPPEGVPAAPAAAPAAAPGQACGLKTDKKGGAFAQAVVRDSLQHVNCNGYDPFLANIMFSDLSEYSQAPEAPAQDRRYKTFVERQKNRAPNGHERIVQD